MHKFDMMGLNPADWPGHSCNHCLYYLESFDNTADWVTWDLQD